jgi:hypothetical protein
MGRTLIVLALVGVAILPAALPARGPGAESTTVEVPWRHGNADTFRAGSPEEGGRYSAVGSLPVTIHRVLHTFDMPLPDRRVLGMRLGFDPDALADARRQVATFLTAHGVMQATQSK